MKSNIFNVFILLTITNSILFCQPATEWVQRYNSPGNYNDYVNDMAVDGQGNVYLTGYSNGDFLTIKYNSAGSLQWAKTYDGPFHGSDEAIAISLDYQKNIYVLGVSRNLYGKLVYATIKYSNSGDTLWIREFINSDSMFTYPSALSVDSSGNVYITGYSFLESNGEDFTTIKYNTNGIFQWVRYYGGTANISDLPYSITNDKNGNVYVTGNIRDSGDIRVISTIKYDSSGYQIWAKKYFFSNNGFRTGIKLQVDKNSNIFVGGYGKDEYNTNHKFILIKYENDGNEKWVRNYYCPSGSGTSYFIDMCIDNYNNIYITGFSDSIQVGWEFTTLKYNNNGDWLWIKRYRKVFNSNDEVNAITLDKFNNVYITGRTDNNSPWYQYSTVKYSADGIFNWAMNYNNNSSFNYNHEAIKVKTDSSGNVYVTGNSEGSGTGIDIATIKYSGPSGISNITNEIPKKCKLFQNYPNPFNSVTSIKYQIAKSEFRSQNSSI